MSPNKTIISLLILAMTVPSLASAAPQNKAEHEKQQAAEKQRAEEGLARKQREEKAAAATETQDFIFPRDKQEAQLS